MRRGVLLCALLAGCGRVGFDDVPLTLDGSSLFSVRIASADDDAEEFSDGVMYLDSDDLELCDDLTSPHLGQLVGVRFIGIPAPRGAKVTRATIQFTVETDPIGGPGMQTLHGERRPALPFSAVDRDLSSRPRTSATVAWVPPLWTVPGASGPDQRTPELAPIVEEILAQPEWFEGSAIALFVTGTGTNQAATYDLSPPSAALLELEYEP